MPTDTARSLQPRPPERLAALLGRRRLGGRRARTIRRALAVALLLAAAALAALSPREVPAGPYALAVTHDLPVGRVLSATDVAVRPVRELPAGALAPKPAAAAGSVLSGPVRRGEILTDARILGDRGPDPGPGKVAVPVPLDDRIVGAVLRPGMHVTLVDVASSGGADAVERSSATGADVRILARDAVVLSVVESSDSVIGSSRGSTFVMGVPAAAADAVTSAATGGAVSVRFAS